MGYTYDPSETTRQMAQIVGLMQQQRGNPEREQLEREALRLREQELKLSVGSQGLAKQRHLQEVMQTLMPLAVDGANIEALLNYAQDSGLIDSTSTRSGIGEVLKVAQKRARQQKDVAESTELGNQLGTSIAAARTGDRDARRIGTELVDRIQSNPDPNVRAAGLNTAAQSAPGFEMLRRGIVNEMPANPVLFVNQETGDTRVINPRSPQQVMSASRDGYVPGTLAGTRTDIGVRPGTKEEGEKALFKTITSISNIVEALKKIYGPDGKPIRGAAGKRGEVSQTIAGYLGQVPLIGRPASEAASQLLAGASKREVDEFRIAVGTLLSDAIKIYTAELSGRVTDPERKLASDVGRVGNEIGSLDVDQIIVGVQQLLRLQLLNQDRLALQAGRKVPPLRIEVRTDPRGRSFVVPRLGVSEQDAAADMELIEKRLRSFGIKGDVSSVAYELAIDMVRQRGEIKSYGYEIKID